MKYVYKELGLSKEELKNLIPKCPYCKKCCFKQNYNKVIDEAECECLHCGKKFKIVKGKVTK